MASEKEPFSGVYWYVTLISGRRTSTTYLPSGFIQSYFIVCAQLTNPHMIVCSMEQNTLDIGLAAICPVTFTNPIDCSNRTPHSAPAFPSLEFPSILSSSPLAAPRVLHLYISTSFQVLHQFPTHSNTYLALPVCTLPTTFSFFTSHIVPIAFATSNSPNLPSSYY